MPRTTRRQETKRLWHLKNRERRLAAAKARYHANPDPKKAQRAHARAYMTEAQREAVRARDRAYRASRKAQDMEYRAKNKERIAQKAHEAYLRRKAQAKKRDPIAAAKRLAEKAAQIARQGYSGKLVA